MCAVFFFFLSRYAHHRDLPSFPTRRSSDLTIWPRRRRGRSSPTKRRPSPSAAAGEERRLVGERSEEHTSELQSRRDLVCRLLLEKKKYNGSAAVNPIRCDLRLLPAVRLV